jgi:GH25 family lysozyme M1 (1,4-beta-N-acetylmuramidase)
MPEEVSIELNDNTFEVYSVKTINDLISDTNVEITNSDKKLKTNKIGEKEIEIEYKYKKRDYKYIVNYEIVDTESPFIIRLSSYRSTLVNEEIDFCEGASFIDNYDREPTCSITGDYDLSIPNTYYLKYEVKDQSGNITNKDLTLDVFEEWPIYDDYEDDDYEETYTLFSKFKKKYKTDDVMLGIDVSFWQGDIDFEAVKDAGAEFVIIRMAYSDLETEIDLDSKFNQNLKAAKDAGLLVGVYIYTSANTKEEAIKQAKFIKKNLNKVKLDFPIVYDFEDWRDFNTLKMNSHDLLERVNEYKSILKEDGYDMMIYGSKWYLENVWLPYDYDTWLAHYTDETDYQGDYILWQVTNDGLIDGIYGYVDLDIYYKK